MSMYNYIAYIYVAILIDPCGFYRSVSHAGGTTLLLESKWLLWPACSFPPSPASPPPPIDSIRDITGTEKTIQKTSSIQVAQL